MLFRLFQLMLFVILAEGSFFSFCNNTFCIFEMFFWYFGFQRIIFCQHYIFFLCGSYCTFPFTDFYLFFSFCLCCKDSIDKLRIAFYLSQCFVRSFLLRFFLGISFSCTSCNIFDQNLRLKNRILCLVD